MTIDRIALITLAAAALGFGAYRAGAANTVAPAGGLMISHVVSGGAANGVSYLWLVDEADRHVTICTARTGEAPDCNAKTATLP